MDYLSLIGLLFGLGFISFFAVSGGTSGSFVNPASLGIVLGGTLAATFLSFKGDDLKAALRALRKVFVRTPFVDPQQLVKNLLAVSLKNKKEGSLVLAKFQYDDPFLSKAVKLLADSPQIDFFRQTLQIEVLSLKRRHARVHQVYQKMGTFAPAFGMLGTIIGLVKMLSKLEDPGTIGPAMAVALVTTFYGSLLSSLVFLPMANKLKDLSQREVERMEIVIEGGTEVIKLTHPILVYDKLSSYMPPGQRKTLEMRL